METKTKPHKPKRLRNRTAGGREGCEYVSEGLLIFLVDLVTRCFLCPQFGGS